MSVWWQDLDTGEIHQVADEATARREAIECLLKLHHRPYVSRTQIPEGHGLYSRTVPCVVPEMWTA